MSKSKLYTNIRIIFSVAQPDFYLYNIYKRLTLPQKIISTLPLPTNTQTTQKQEWTVLNEECDDG